jgi:hypothetical protein
LKYEEIDFEAMIAQTEKSMMKVNTMKILNKYKKHFNQE